MKIFCLYDSKANYFGTPFFSENVGEVLRDFETVSNDRQTKVGLYPQDFTLFELGTYDKLTAKFELHLTPYALASAIQYVKSPLPLGILDESKVAVVN